MKDRPRPESAATVDSGCNSVTTDEDLSELYQDFRNEKVADTKTRLQALMGSIPEAQDKSLLLQTVALFETLLKKIHTLQAENDGLKGNEQLVLELEAAREELRSAHARVDDLTARADEVVALRRELEQREAAHAQVTEMQHQVEAVLKRQVTELQGRIASGVEGRQSESQMYEDAVVKAAHLEKTVTELSAKVRTKGSLKNYFTRDMENYNFSWRYLRCVSSF